MITLDNLTYQYRKGARPALSDVTASIRPGIHLLAGENGAGKTTLLHIMAGLRTPTAGECLIEGVNSQIHSPYILERLFLLEENMTFPARDIFHLVKMHAQFYPGFSAEVLCKNLADFNMTGHESLKHASLGTRKKAQLAYVLSLGLNYLFLDEPTNGLDIQSKAILSRMIARNVEPHQTLIVSTHTIGDLETMFDGMIMISGGKCLFAATTDEISGKLAFETSRFPVSDAIYQEQMLGNFKIIAKANDNDTPTRPDFRLLYNAVYTPARESIISLLNNRISHD